MGAIVIRTRYDEGTKSAEVATSATGDGERGTYRNQQWVTYDEIRAEKTEICQNLNKNMKNYYKLSGQKKNRVQMQLNN
jgi:hypothetical protein